MNFKCDKKILNRFEIQHVILGPTKASYGLNQKGGAELPNATVCNTVHYSP